MDYYVFDDLATFTSCNNWLTTTGHGSGLIDPAKITIWADPSGLQRLDGKWVMECVPDALVALFPSATIDYFNTTFPHVVETYDVSWFAEDGE